MPYPGSNAIPISGPIGLNSSGELIPTHFDFLGQGGFRSVADITELHAIIENRRSWGMLVYVRSNSTYYKLCSDTEGGVSPLITNNNNWIALQNGLIIICPAGLTWEGIFNPATVYQTNDVVQYTDPNTQVTASYWAVSTPSGNPTDINGDPNSAGGWQLFSAVGPQGGQGDQGDQGDPGNKWYTGTTTPDLAGLSGIVEGDLYLHLPTDGNTNPANGDVYVYQNGDWVDAPVGNIQGPDGSDGGGVWPYGSATTTAIIANSGYSQSGQSLVGLTAFQILQKLLFPYQAPTLTQFNVYTNSAGTTLQSNDVIIGTSISGIRYFKVTTNNSANFVAMSFKIEQQQTGVSGTQYIYGTLSNPSQPIPASNTTFVTTSGSEINVDTAQYNTGGSYVKWRAQASSNQTPNQIVNSSYYQVNWRYPVYYGVLAAASPSNSAIQSLSSVLKDSQSGTYNINYTGPDLKYIYIAYPVSGDSFGNFTTMVKPGPLGEIPLAQVGGYQCTTCDDYSVADGSGKYYKQVTLTINGINVDYRIYRSNYALSAISSITI